MKEKRPIKRLNGFSTLAIFGVLAILLIECLFVFEVYGIDFKKIEPFLPASVSPTVERWLEPFKPFEPLKSLDPIEASGEELEPEPEPEPELGLEPEPDVPADTNAPPVEAVPVG